jgi:predicted nucleic acid-binding protein
LGTLILADSNILIDVIEVDPHWYDWSVAALTDASRAGRIFINQIIVAEVAPFSGPLDLFLQRLDDMGVDIEPICNQTAYAAGIAFQDYRNRRDKSAPKSIIADFLIGGHAQVLGATILTRDPRFYRAYFPTVPLITPDSD